MLLLSLLHAIIITQVDKDSDISQACLSYMLNHFIHHIALSSKMITDQHPLQCSDRSRQCSHKGLRHHVAMLGGLLRAYWRHIGRALFSGGYGEQVFSSPGAGMKIPSKHLQSSLL